jgi:hypothetical protein
MGYLRKRMRSTRFLLGVAAVAALVVALLMVGAAAAGSRSAAPTVEIQGNTYSNTTGITGQVVQQTQFSMNAQSGGKAPTSGWFEDQLYNVNGDGTLSQVAFYNVKVKCMSANKSTGNVWFSGLVTAGDDQRLGGTGTAERQQLQNIIAAGNLILYGRLHVSNGSADQRSLFVTQATTAYPNAYLSSGDDGTLASPWFISGNATSAASACLLHDNAFQTADYQVVDGPSNQVQWLEPDDTTTVGSPFAGTAANMMSPPTASVYSLASFNRTLGSPTLYVTLR